MCSGRSKSLKLAHVPVDLPVVFHAIIIIKIIKSQVSRRVGFNSGHHGLMSVSHSYLVMRYSPGSIYF